MAAAFGWGTLAASSLVIGALVALRFRISLRVIGLIMAFGAGVLTTWCSIRLRASSGGVVMRLAGDARLPGGGAVGHQ